MKQKHYIAGLYYRLSQEDERQGESVSIDNQRAILRKYAEERGFEIHGEYIDDGVSGTTFDRPEVQRLLDDAKTGRSWAVCRLCLSGVRYPFYRYTG